MKYLYQHHAGDYCIKFWISSFFSFIFLTSAFAHTYPVPNDKPTINMAPLNEGIVMMISDVGKISDRYISGYNCVGGSIHQGWDSY